MATFSDTSPAVERILIEGFRSMTPSQKLERVAALNRALVELSRAGLRTRYGADMSEEEMRLRLASLRLDARVMVEVFGWDPSVHGL